MTGRLWILAATATAIALSGCGGGSGGSGATQAPPTSTSAPPAPPPPTASRFPPAPFGLTVSQHFAPLGWLYPAGSAEPQLIQSDQVPIRWSAEAGKYELSLPNVGSGFLEYRFPGENPYAFKLVSPSGTPLDVAVILDDGRFYDPAFGSVGLFEWITTGPGPSGWAAFGLQSTPADLPGHGVVRYLTFGSSVAGQGATNSIQFVFDFDNGTLSGDIGVAWADDWGPHEVTRYDFAQTDFARGRTTFMATFAVPGAPTEGFLTGRFMGTGARELAVAWRGPVRNPYSGEWIIASGVVLGRVCSDCD